ncbi:contractile injection system protein, VgrG/Pvc8 family [Profundibacterium mesophilum]|uniref:Phage tail protein D n=1 Tax=Profundibacterium mesophilum KAUST100406-0324 TaxID=1037889 RepID=A0A921TFS7_9RHOB|nr:contractile injection system protein, VgrG/Pvc8 family [Profundibacterium mesophilum]KAF0676724.1 Phage tail protein D [Profundibacterium mesophilum KAUST100406-0324]
MTPDLQLRANGTDISAALRDRLISLELVDAAGITSDRLRIDLDDRDAVLAIPPEGAVLELALGFRETGLTAMGRFSVDRREGSGPPARMSIEAKAADMTAAIRAPKTRAWPAATLGQIASTIAAEAGLTATIAPELAGIAYELVAQTAESDLHLLTRLAAPLDAAVKPASGRLVLVPRGSAALASGETLAPADVAASEMTSYSWAFEERTLYKSATAEWSDVQSAALRKVTAGSGAPEQRLRHPFGSEAEARRAAEAALARAGPTFSPAGSSSPAGCGRN